MVDEDSMKKNLRLKPPPVVLEKAKDFQDWQEAVKELYPMMLKHLALHVQLDLETEPQELVKKAKEYDLMQLTHDIFRQVQGSKTDEEVASVSQGCL